MCVVRLSASCRRKLCCKLSQDNLEYYDNILKISRDRYQAGDIAQTDLDRLELQRLQYESDLQTALVNLRTTKINLLALLDERRSIDSFDVDGAFDFREDLLSLDDYRKDALDNRPDLKAAVLTRPAGRNQLQAGGSQRLDRSDHRRLVHPQRFIQQPRCFQHSRRQRQHSAAHLRYAIRARNCARRSTSTATKSFARASRPRSTATWTPHTQPSPATSIF